MIPQQIPVNEWAFVAIVALVFGYIGWRRGLTVTLYMLTALAIGVMFSDRIAKPLEPWVNFTWKISLAVARERAFSPEEMFRAAVKEPALITQQVHRIYLGTVVFLLLLATGFAIGRVRAVKARPPRTMTRILAALVGTVNGYLVAFFLFPRLITTPTTVITMSNVNIRNFLQVQLGFPILITILVVIAAGVLGAREGRSKGK
jgi:hypothetical protein